jgi:predicted small secreted protein
VAYSSNSYDKTVENITTIPTIDEKQAITISNAELKFLGAITFQESKLFVYNKEQSTKLVYRVVTSAEDVIGSWEVIVDAKTSQILSKKDISLHHSEKGNKKEKISKERNAKKEQKLAPLGFVTGTGMVYASDPLGVNRSAYAGEYVDGAGAGDVTNASLDAARISITLPEIDLTAGVYKLKSSYVEIKNLENPNKGLFTQATSAFNFNRNQDGFEAVNVFYHTDKNLRYINETLGVNCRPLTNAGVLWFDPSGENGADNSHYVNGTLVFGEGCVDDGEDGDVIWHELGHGLHDWMTGGSLSQVNGLSEGSGDYWAQSNSRSLNQWLTTDAAYHYMFNWDGHNPCWGGRTTNYAPIYPGGLVGQIHTDGQIWATVNMKIWDVIGREKTDRAFLEGLALTNSSTNQQSAAIAVRQAAINMCYPCADVLTMTQKYTAAGYTMSAVPLKICCPDTQTVNAGVGNTYTVPSYTSLSNAISQTCNAVITQSPAIGANLAPGTYPVTMTATSGTSVNCGFSLVVQPFLGIEDYIKQNLKVYPNPASTNITIKGDFIADQNISIYNVLGQKVMQSTLKSDENVLDISSLALGVYTIRFNETKTTIKFVKN